MCDSLTVVISDGESEPGGGKEDSEEENLPVYSHMRFLLISPMSLTEFHAFKSVDLATTHQIGRYIRVLPKGINLSPQVPKK